MNLKEDYPTHSCDDSHEAYYQTTTIINNDEQQQHLQLQQWLSPSNETPQRVLVYDSLDCRNNNNNNNNCYNTHSTDENYLLPAILGKSVSIYDSL